MQGYLEKEINMKILIAEDDASTRRILEVALTKWCYDVVTAKEGDEALEKLLAKDAPKLALLDWVMPGVEGPDICVRLRQEDHAKPTYIILLTARRDTMDLIQGLGAGADDYIPKPFDNDVLRARVDVGRRVVELQSALAEKKKLQGVVEMAGAICHELNQPMQVILGLCQLLKMDVEKDHPLYDHLSVIGEQTDKMGKITKKLMMGIMTYETKKYLKGQIVDIGRATGAPPTQAAG